MQIPDPCTSDHASRTVVPSHRIQVTGEMARVGAPSQTLAHEPRVDVIREGDEVRAIDVTCPCGQRVRLQCVYDS
jgi:hypothetical protein